MNHLPLEKTNDSKPGRFAVSGNRNCSGGDVSRTYHFKSGARMGRALGMTLSLSLGLFASNSWAFSLDDVAAKAEKLRQRRDAAQRRRKTKT